MNQISEVALSTEAQRLYLNYALSVIQSRALPDVRDGLKPVQRRILYTMQKELHLSPDGKPVKCARIVGDTMGKYHPHGDASIYDTLVRMTQDWVLRAPLVRGQGNFGSLDGDAPASFRYTEAKLEKIALELLEEIGQKTVDFRPSFDAERFEPIVLPAKFPNLLVNGAYGIAVGMATSIPPHNLREVIDALTLLVQEPGATVAKLLTKIKGPDFPTGGELTSTKADLRKIYETGHGGVKLRGQWKLEKAKNGAELVIITSVPYALEKRVLVEKIADVIIARKLPPLIDVRDESTDEVRVVLEMKKGTNPELVMAYLFKHTPLQSNVSFNMTCLVPTDRPDVQTPQRLDLKTILQHFLDFRFEVTTRRLEFELAKLKERLHILEGLEAVFDALDEIIRIIRRSEGKQDAAAKIMKRFKLDDVQTDAILELKLYRLAKLEILIIQKEANEKRKAAKRIEGLLRGKAKRWTIVTDELAALKEEYGDRRRTKILGADNTPEFSAEDFIVDEDAIVIVTQMGWVKRQGSVKDLSTTRLKKDDRVLACMAGSTRACVAFFSSKGHCYVIRIADIPASTGYGDPIQKLFKFDDGERIVGATSFDSRQMKLPEEEEYWEDGTPCPPYGIAISKLGQALRFPLFGHREVSTRSGRKFARLKPGDEIISTFVQLDEQIGYVIVAAQDGHAMALDVEDLAVLSGPGRGTIFIKLADNVELIGARLAKSVRTEPLVVRTDKGKKYELFAEAQMGTRGGRGKSVVKRSTFASVDWELPEIPELSE